MPEPPPYSLTTPVAVRVWDLPTRLFHWALAVCLVGSFVSVNIGGLAMNWHFRFGYAIGTLLLFRLVWGFVGGHWSRFASFLYGPGAVWGYLRGDRGPAGRWWDVGHSPLGALSVYALLIVLALQVGSGLFTDDEIAFAGPLTRFASSDFVTELSRYHKGIGRPLVIILVLLHLLAIAYHALLRRRTLVRPMISGDKQVSPDTPPSRDDWRMRLLAGAVLAVCAAVVAWLVGGGA